MSHVNARLTVHGRQLIVDRMAAGRPVAHIAAELGVSRQTAYRWVGRYRAEGTAGLRDRSSRPRSSPRRTSADREQEVLQARQALRFGPLRIAAVTGVPARTVTRILHRHQVPRLADCDPLTGTPIRASRASSNRYERTTPGELVHLDVKKLGRIPAGGGWRAHGRSEQVRGRGIGYDYVHVAIDDHTRVGYAEVLPDEKGVTAAGFLVRAGTYFAEQGITRIERVITDNAFAYRNSAAFARAVADLGAVQRFIKPHCPWTNGKAERFNRTLQTEWAYRQVFTSSAQRQAALAPWLQHYNTERIHTGIGTTPITRVSPT
ncbi:IS481 family transposase [Arthrobacter burdickii]|uniref:IS481 family transposase n=1 Tax=Arthrobacter burdickii TaxID=3035920 RepID=A0ABT8K6T9_9MICC|nr:IS481 family transposase [Arthrobacter burdickii]MDN4612733.1 IS481 family transposase [Arthrobacter burdickii]